MLQTAAQLQIFGQSQLLTAGGPSGASRTAVERARRGDGPSLVECKTYRYYGHHQGDETLRYRTQEEESDARARDPLAVFRTRSSGAIQAAELDELETRSRAHIDEAVRFAESSPLPGLDELYTHVYVE